MQENGVKCRPIILGEFPITNGNPVSIERTQDNTVNPVLSRLLESELAELSRQYPKVDLKVLDHALFRGVVAYASLVHSQVTITPPAEILEKYHEIRNHDQVDSDSPDSSYTLLNIRRTYEVELRPVTKPAGVQEREAHDRPINEAALRGISPRAQVMQMARDMITSGNCTVRTLSREECHRGLL